MHRQIAVIFAKARYTELLIDAISQTVEVKLLLNCTHICGHWDERSKAFLEFEGLSNAYQLDRLSLYMNFNNKKIHIINSREFFKHTIDSKHECS